MYDCFTIIADGKDSVDENKIMKGQEMQVRCALNFWVSK